MPQLMYPNYILDDLRMFISENYHLKLPHSLLIAQAFILRCPKYGKKFGLPTINSIIEEWMKQGRI